MTPLLISVALVSLAADPAPAYAGPMREVAKASTARPGVVLHIGDSITYANPYGQWARAGAGQTAADQATLTWMHTGANDDTDGWWLARFDHPAGGRSHTACAGVRADELRTGGRNGLPAFDKLLDQYRPQIIVLMIGTNDASAGRPLPKFLDDVAAMLDIALAKKVVPILSTIPPHPRRTELAASYNIGLRELAVAKKLPLIDFEKEILTRRPTDWNGTLLGKNDVHLTIGSDGVTATSAPTPENLARSGYLLRGWLSVRAIGEVKKHVFDAMPQSPPRADITLPITRDTWLSAVGDEAKGSNGGSPRLKIKSIQELALLDFDAAPLVGKTVAKATLHLKTASPAEPLRRVTVSSFAADWVEGKSSGYRPEVGSSSFAHRIHPNEPWAFPGSAITDVSLGRGGTVWGSFEATPPDADGWQRVAVDPRVVMARSSGISKGLLVFDDTGSEWTRDGERFAYKLFPNRFLNSRESQAKSAPYLTIELGGDDNARPDAPKAVTPPLLADRRPPVGDGLDLYWETPADRGAGIVGFKVTIDGKTVPQYLVPAPGGVVRMRLRPGDIALSPTFTTTVTAIDGAGNASDPLTLHGIFPGWAKPFAWSGNLPKADAVAVPLLKLGAAEIAVIDPLDKVHPVTGATIPTHAASYFTANHLWSNGTITLQAARNEFVGIQLVVRGTIEGMTAEVVCDDKHMTAEISRYAYVASKLGPLPDPLVPFTGRFAVPTPEEKIAGQTTGSLYVEFFVGHATTPGKHTGTLKLRAGSATLDLPIELTAHTFALPDRLTFIPEMNCYGLPADERDYYRLAHRHRTVLNKVPYSQRGEVADGCAPKGTPGAFDWSAWDARFGPLFDGSAFADLPRKNVPLELFYLPLHENWPTLMAGNYSGSYWADEAFPASYRAAFVTAAADFAKHLSDRGWHQTLFQGFLNNKVDFKKNGWSRGSSPWLLDEPANWQDYWALKWYGDAFHAGRRSQSTSKAKLLFRADISRPEWQRDALDDVLDYNVVSGQAFHQYHRVVVDRRDRFGQIVMVYGGTNPLEANNIQPVGWCLDAWTRGADGVVPWQTVGTAASWSQADDLALFYPSRAADRGPVPSIRLKAYLRGQQDVEYLAMLEATTGQSRTAIGDAVRSQLKLAPAWQSSGRVDVEDAGVIGYGDLSAAAVSQLRSRVAAELTRMTPKPPTPLTATPIPTRSGS